MYAIRSYYAAHLGADGKQTAILALDNILRNQWPDKAWPAGAGFVLVNGAEQRLAGDDVHIDA